MDEVYTAEAGNGRGKPRTPPEVFARATVLEDFGTDWWRGRCPLPSCRDDGQGLTVWYSGDGVWKYACDLCLRNGGEFEFARHMRGLSARPPAFGDPYPLGEAMRDGIEPPDELERGVLLKGKVHWIYGAAGEGKSWLALWLVKRALDRGERVMYLDSENGPRVIAERLERLGASPERVAELLHYHPFPELTDAADVVEEFHAELEAWRPGLIVYDSLANFLGASGMEESSNDDLIKWAANYTRPARALEITTVVLDHPGHNGDHARGASRKRDEADVMWAVKCSAPFDRNTVGRITLRRDKDREAWLPERLGFSVGGSTNGFVFRSSDGNIEEPDPESGLTVTERKVLEVLRSEFAATGATAAEWKRASSKPLAKVSEPSFYRALRTLKSLSLVDHRGEGRDSKYFPKNGPDDSGGGENADSDFSRSESEDSPNYQSLAEHYHDSDDSEHNPTNYHRYHHPFRGDSDDSGRAGREEALIRDVFERAYAFRGMRANRDAYLESKTDERLEAMTRTACLNAGVVPERWREFRRVAWEAAAKHEAKLAEAARRHAEEEGA